MNEEKNIKNKNILSVFHGKKSNKVPFWLMRQAGRYLPEYKKLRADAGSFLDLVYNSKKASEITMQPIRRFGMDGAILFSDILVVPHAMGQSLQFESGFGPKLVPVRHQNDIDRLNLDKIHERLSPIYETIDFTQTKLKQENYSYTSLIGFAGAPWTVACYMIEGQGSKDFLLTKQWMINHNLEFNCLISKITEATIDYLIHQIDAGVEAIQIFDSWSGILNASLFEKFVIEPTKIIVEAIRKSYPNIPIIGFPRKAGTNLVKYAECTKVDILALDETVDPLWVFEHLPNNITIQGNLDPIALLKGGKDLETETLKILNCFKNRPFIFNLGHGVIKETPVHHVEQLAHLIKEYDQ